MGHADGKSTDYSGFPSHRIDGPDLRYQGANVNLPAQPGQALQEAPSHGETVRQMLENWDLDSFRRQQSSLDKASVQKTIGVPAFVRALYAEDDVACRRMAALANRQAGGPQQFADSLLVPAARQTGQDWLDDAADFLKVTIAITRLQRFFGEACSAFPPPEPKDPAKRLLMAATPGNQHSLGLAMVEDAFRRDGWLVDGGTDTADALVCRVASSPYRIVGLSIGSGKDLAGLGMVTRALRARSMNPSLKLMAGGSFAGQDRQAVFAAGFDLVFSDAATAVRDAAAIGGIRPSPPSGA